MPYVRDRVLHDAGRHRPAQQSVSSVFSVVGAVWPDTVNSERRAAVLTVAREVASRATDPARITQALTAARVQTRFPQALQREAYGIASGEAGLAVLCAAFDQSAPSD